MLTNNIINVATIRYNNIYQYLMGWIQHYAEIASLIYMTLLHLIKTSPKFPAKAPSINSSQSANCYKSGMLKSRCRE